MGLERKIITVGSSTGVILPVYFIKAKKISNGDRITLEAYEFIVKEKVIKSSIPFTRKIIKFANSMGFTIPASILRADGVKKGDLFVLRKFRIGVRG